MRFPIFPSSIDWSGALNWEIRAVAHQGGDPYAKPQLNEAARADGLRSGVHPFRYAPPFLLGMGYWRGRGVYLSNGYLEMQGATVVENLVRGVARTDSKGRRNLAGGIAATVGNAHAVESMTIGHSIVAGNSVQEIEGATYAHDVFTGSLMYFHSAGYNRFGVLDFSQILVPVGEPGWASLCRRHYPKAGDAAGVELDTRSGEDS